MSFLFSGAGDAGERFGPGRRSLRPGEALGRYTLLERLARGGMGEVWLASARGSLGFEKRLVLKTILPERSNTRLYVELFAREARLSARLSHPNLVEVFDFGEDDGVFYLAMEYLRGRSLSQALGAARRRGVRLPPWFALQVIADCCRGLDYAHRRTGIIHCDLSPGNLMVEYAGLAKIVDFGVAFERGKRGRDDQLKGKLAYMAPERIRDHACDRRSDVYSLGVILYLLFTGHLPFPHRDDRELAAAIISGGAKPPGRIRPIAGDIETIITTAMARRPAQRYPSAAALGAAIDAVLARYKRPSLQLDVATYLGSLFPEDRELPAPNGAPIRRAETIDTAVAVPAGKGRRPPATGDLGAIEIDLCLEEDGLQART